MNHKTEIGIAVIFSLRIFIASLLILASPMTYAGVDDNAAQPSSAQSKEVFVDDGISITFLFAIERFSDDQKLVKPMGVWYDKHHDEIYIADTGNNRVVVFGVGGEPRFQIRGIQGLSEPLDILVDAESQIYVSQMEKRSLQIFDFRGEHLMDLYAPDATPFKPGRMCFDVDGKLYLVDRENARILVYDTEGNFQFQFGRKGTEEGEFQLISGIAVDNAGRIYVADSKQYPVQIFDRRGRFLYTFGARGPRKGEFSFPGGIFVDTQGRLWITDTFRHQVKVFKTDGTHLFQFGTFGSRPGQFFFPIDIALDENNRIYVLEKGASRLQVLRIQE